MCNYSHLQVGDAQLLELNANSEAIESRAPVVSMSVVGSWLTKSLIQWAGGPLSPLLVTAAKVATTWSASSEQHHSLRSVSGQTHASVSDAAAGDWQHHDWCSPVAVDRKCSNSSTTHSSSLISQSTSSLSAAIRGETGLAQHECGAKISSASMLSFVFIRYRANCEQCFNAFNSNSDKCLIYCFFKIKQTLQNVWNISLSTCSETNRRRSSRTVTNY